MPQWQKPAGSGGGVPTAAEPGMNWDGIGLKKSSSGQNLGQGTVLLLGGSLTTSG